jgi:hypothetical protein
MGSVVYTEAYTEHLLRGPFPGSIDPWAENARYFQQLHGNMIGLLLQTLHIPLVRMGYVLSREVSLQITALSEPDIAILSSGASAAPGLTWDYAAAAQAQQADPGTVTSDAPPELEGLTIRLVATGELVTIIEIISPSNKREPDTREEYLFRREGLVKRAGVNVVEFDLTRSIKRLLRDYLVRVYPYHIAIFLPAERPRFVGIDYLQPLKRIALPLRGEVIGLDTQPIYDAAYQQGTLAGLIEQQGDYTEAMLPFPSTLSPEARAASLEAVARWRNQLATLARTDDLSNGH